MRDATILRVDGDGLAVSVRRRGGEERIVETASNEAGFALAARALAARRSLPPLTIGMPAAPVLRKRLSLPLAARANLEGLLGFEIDRETPFASDEVYWTYELERGPPAHGRIGVELIMVPRAVVDPVLAAARRAGLDPVAVAASLGAESWTAIRLANGSRMHHLGRRQSLVALASAACVLGAVAAVLPFIRQQLDFAGAETALAALTVQAQEAAALRQLIDRASAAAEFLASERGRTGSALAALAAVTRALPDTTYLTAFSLRGGRLTLTGLSPGAAGLVSSLAGSPAFRDPAFASPVVQSEGGLELFTITVALPPQPGPS